MSAAVPESLGDSSDSHTGDDARHFLREWRAAKDHYSKATWENGRHESCLEASQAALLTTEEEASAVRARLAESDTMVVGKMIFKKTSVLTPSAFILTTHLFL